uniref:Uncharacterized protein n=1 Tax=Romanomermis culicivorax TaxID=13658 RepID=A0A915KUZ7_ROMCU
MVITLEQLQSRINERDVMERRLEELNDVLHLKWIPRSSLAIFPSRLGQSPAVREFGGYKMSEDNQGGLRSSGLPRTLPGKKVHDLEKLIVLTSAESLAEKDNGSDHRPLSVDNEGQIPTASTAVERKDDKAILSTNQDHLFKIPSSTNLLRRGHLLELPITGLARPIPKMNILVVDQHSAGR